MTASIQAASARGGFKYWLVPKGSSRDLERCAAVLAFAVVLGQQLPELFPGAFSMTPAEAGAPAAPGSDLDDKSIMGRERIVGGYIGIPSHDRSDVHLDRPGGTDLTMKQLRWDAEPFNFPLYAGVRGTWWFGPFGGMIDFLHDKAIARTGKGAHGRKVTGERAIVDVVGLEGTIKGAPAPAESKITDILERLEFSHGHNVLLPTALVRLTNFWIRPYAGLGGGIAVPHVEVWPAGEGDIPKTNEYQVAGPAAQAVFGLEIPLAHGPVFIEYKFTWASLNTNLTGGKTPSWCNCDFVSDFARNIPRWLRGEQPAYGHLSTTILTHQVVVGTGYRRRS